MGAGDHLQFPPSILNPPTLNCNPVLEKDTREMNPDPDRQFERGDIPQEKIELAI